MRVAAYEEIIHTTAKETLQRVGTILDEKTGVADKRFHAQIVLHVVEYGSVPVVSRVWKTVQRQ